MGSKTTSRAGRGGGKQNASKVSSAKGQQQHQKSESSEKNVVHQADLSVLRQPINISVKGICDIVKVYQTCTSELKHLLDNELDIIYECKVCQNLFRSMANAISHKRVYCRQHYNEALYSFNKRRTVDDYTVIIQPEPVVPSAAEKESWHTSDKNPTTESNNEVKLNDIKANVPRIVNSKPKKDLTQIIEELSDKKGLKNFKESVGHYSASNFYEDVNKSLVARAQNRREHAIHLEPTGSPAGVFQTKLQATSSTNIQPENIDLMKEQVYELQHMVRETEAILNEDGKIIQIRPCSNGPQIPIPKEVKPPVTPVSKVSRVKNDHVCTQCGSSFSTRKTLAHHTKSLHTTYRLCYPCPCCKSTYTNSWSVYRHLYKVHRKTAAQVRKLRPQIQSKAFKKDIAVDKQNSDHATVIKVEPSEQEVALNEQFRIDQENKEWMDNFEDDQELQRCGGCGRRFERRAALMSHSQICQKRIAARKIKTQSSVQITLEKSVVKNGNADTLKLKMPIKETENKTEPIAVCETTRRTRQMSGSNWSELPKKEVLGKRIEIQIRRDYCKYGTSVPSTSQQQSSSFSRSESPESIPNVSTFIKEETESLLSEVETDTDSSKNRNFDSRLDVSESHFMGTDKLPEVSHLEMCQARSTSSPLNEAVKEPAKGRASAKKPLRPKRKQDSIDQESPSSYDNTANPRKKLAIMDSVTEIEGSLFEISENIKHKAQRRSSEEHFSPVMEKKMHSLINRKRLQCLPCQRKFNKLPNLRRHVAVHIGWNRYRCPICSYKCFAKYDCVHHMIKVHGKEKSDAQQMVQLIESQGSDTNSVEKSPVLTTTLKTVKATFRKRVRKKIKSERNMISEEEFEEKKIICEKIEDNNDMGASYLPASPEQQKCKTEEDSVQLIFDGETTNKNIELGDSRSPLNCLDDGDLGDSEVSSVVPDGEPVINSMENNCNDTVLNFIDENFQSGAPSINGDNADEDEAMEDALDDAQEDEQDDVQEVHAINDVHEVISVDDDHQTVTDDSRSDYENDSDIPETGSPASTDSKKNALRRMVMEVIFGSQTANQIEPPITVENGIISNRASPEIVEETVAVPEEEPPEETVAFQSDSSGKSSVCSGIERRKQPMRTRVCVRHEDFIYEGPSANSISVSRKAYKSQTQHVEAPTDRVPKVTLVRVGGYSSSTETNGSQNTSAWRSSLTSATESHPVSSAARTTFSLPARKSTKITDLEKNNVK